MSVFLMFYILQFQHSPVNAKTEIDINDCVCIVISSGISEIASEVKQTPDVILNSLGLAFHQVISRDSVCCMVLVQC